LYKMDFRRVQPSRLSKEKALKADSPTRKTRATDANSPTRKTRATDANSPTRKARVPKSNSSTRKARATKANSPTRKARATKANSPTRKARATKANSPSRKAHATKANSSSRNSSSLKANFLVSSLSNNNEKKRKSNEEPQFQSLAKKKKGNTDVENFEKLKAIKSFLSGRYNAMYYGPNGNLYINGNLKKILSVVPLPAEYIEILKVCFKDILTKSSLESADIIKERFKELLKNSKIEDLEMWKSDRYNYVDVELLASSQNLIYSATQIPLKSGKEKSERVAIKCYINDRDAYEEKEFLLQNLLYDKGLNVPRLFPMFETTFFRCYPMELLDTNLFFEETDVIWKLEDQKRLEKLNEVWKNMYRIFVGIHNNGYIYVDLSPSNVGFKNGELYLMDFGQAVKILPPCVLTNITIRYAPRNYHLNMIREVKTKGSVIDDYEELGYLLLELYYGQDILVDTDNIEENLVGKALEGLMEKSMKAKNDLIMSFVETKKKDPASLFFKKYFQILTTTDSSKIDKEYEKLIL
jgi:hypothetical protein